MAKAWIGLSGYSYKPWQGEGRFYPPGLKQTEFFGFYQSRYQAVEMDGTWYRMPSEKSAEEWNAKSAPDFRYSFKLHRDITHFARLKVHSIGSLRFMLQRLGPVAAGGKLGPFLIQLPPNLKRDDDRLTQFLDNLPTSVEATPEPRPDSVGAQGGRPGPSGQEPVLHLPRPLEWAVEFRHESWNTAEVEAILLAHKVSWVAAETDEEPAQRRDTGPSHYARLRRTDYTNEQLLEWAKYFAGTGKDCYIYCKHEDEGAPWIWADILKDALGS